MKITSSLFGEIELHNCPPDPINYENIEGYYVIFKNRSGFMTKDYISIARIRLDEYKQEYVLDVCGQETKYSEELARYACGAWWFSDKIL